MEVPDNGRGIGFVNMTESSGHLQSRDLQTTVSSQALQDLPVIRALADLDAEHLYSFFTCR